MTAFTDIKEEAMSPTEQRWQWHHTSYTEGAEMFLLFILKKRVKEGTFSFIYIQRSSKMSKFNHNYYLP